MVNSNFSTGGDLEINPMNTEEDQPQRTKEQQMAYDILGYAPGLSESSEGDDDY
jgi:hypothetical protein